MTQINVRFQEKMLNAIKNYSEEHGFANIQDFIRETIRQKIYDENIGGIYTYMASEKSLAKTWNTKEEDEAWHHLQKET